MIRKSVEKLHPYTPGEQPKDPSVIKLNTNENPYPPSPAVAEALAALDLAKLRKYPDPVATELRQAIARLHGVRLEQVIVGNGSDELLAMCTRAFVEPDGLISYLEPSYSLYPVLSDIADVRQETVPLQPGFVADFSDVPDAGLFLLTNPNAPTSMAADPAAIQAFCEAFAGVVIIDEAYVDFAAYDCVELAKRLPNVIVMRTFSKSYSLAGIRLGYAIGPTRLIEALFKIKDSYNINALSQAAGLAAVLDQPAMRANAEKIIATRTRATKELVEMGYEVLPSQTNFLFIKPPGIDAEVICQQLRSQNVIVRYFPGEVTGAYLRVTVGTDDEMDTFLNAL
ncbi:MAG: histidinol-phosphate aminotransferase [Kiritimatiellia bacterium]|jgi:histidinol-phosphate aminotransferase